jgi:hypothetical protein
VTLWDFPNQLNIDSVRGDTLRMGQPVEITRTSLTASELHGQAVKIKDGTVVRRVLRWGEPAFAQIASPLRLLIRGKN